MASFAEAPPGDAAKGAKIFKTKCVAVERNARTKEGFEEDGGLEGKGKRGWTWNPTMRRSWSRSNRILDRGN